MFVVLEGGCEIVSGEVEDRSAHAMASAQWLFDMDVYDGGLTNALA